ncbi:hypothetical protein LTR70_009006 [Exophiala xenobiotica]|uniref:Uncharacterized protein n=1 Tax=Lithohypha guttulata TaxID=1690604 RepID=A0ABR0JYY8_9EURO|nr:hypothetical protein LTR24_008776 [Lithohypha guttulata]KAK5311112.1 hypothetical protein LTR70_009006 [Exophiala xenobiotica]
MSSAHTQLPARRARIVRRCQGQVFIRPASTQAPQASSRSRVDSAINELMNQLSQVNLDAGAEVDIASVDYDNIVNELSSRLANTNFQVVAEDDEGYASGKSSSPRTKQHTDDSRGLASSEVRNYREGRAYLAYDQKHQANVIRLNPMAIPEYFWDTLEIKDRQKIQAMGGSSSTPVEQMKAMLVRAQNIVSNGQDDDWLVRTELERRLDELF